MQPRPIASHSPPSAAWQRAYLTVAWRVCPVWSQHIAPQVFFIDKTTYLFNEASQELDDPLESIMVERRVCTEHTKHVDELVVYSIVLGGKLTEEHARHIRNFLVTVLETLGHLTQLTLNLDLSSKNQESQGHQARTLDAWVTVVETAVQEVGVFIDEVVEANSHITQRNDEIASHNSVLTSLENGEKKAKVVLAVF